MIKLQLRLIYHLLAVKNHLTGYQKIQYSFRNTSPIYIVTHCHEWAQGGHENPWIYKGCIGGNFITYKPNNNWNSKDLEGSKMKRGEIKGGIWMNLKHGQNYEHGAEKM